MPSPGLTVAEAARRLSAGGPNSVPGRARVSVWSRIGAQLRDPLIVVLLAASALTVLTGDLADTVVIALVVVVNTAVGVSQEMRADRAITALAELTAPSVRVVRGGTEQMVPSADLVPDDLVVLYEKIRASSSGTGAARLHQRRCEGCHMELNPTDLQRIATAPADEVLRCEDCRRILVRVPESGL